MFLIRMAMRQVKTVRKLVNNVKPIVYPVSSILFAYSIFSNKSKKDMELGQEPHESFNLIAWQKSSLEHKVNSITADAVRNALETFGITSKLLINLFVEYRTLLKKFISVHEEILDGNISDISDTKLNSLLELQSEIRAKKLHIIIMENYMRQVTHLMNSAMTLNILWNIRDVTVEQQTLEILNKLGKEGENTLELERAYWHVKQQCIEKTKTTFADSKWFKVLLFQADD